MIEMYVDLTPAQVDAEVQPASEPLEFDAQEHFIKGDTGERGERGERGEKGDPFRYEDFTPAQLASLKGEKGEAGRDGRDGVDGRDGYTPRKNVDYFDGKDGADGRDGYTPVKNVDYFDGRDGKDGKDGNAYVITQADYQNIARLVPTPEVAWDNIAGKPDTFAPATHTHSAYALKQEIPAVYAITDVEINNICKPRFKGYTITFLAGGSYYNETIYIGLIDGTRITKTKTADYTGTISGVEWIACSSSEVEFDKAYTFYREVYDQEREYSTFMGSGSSDRLFLKSDIGVKAVRGD